MNRRLFLRLIPVATASAALAPALNSEVLKPKPHVSPPYRSATGEEYLAEINKIVDSVNGRLISMSEDEMQVRASLSLSEYLKRYG